MHKLEKKVIACAAPWGKCARRALFRNAQHGRKNSPRSGPRQGVLCFFAARGRDHGRAYSGQALLGMYNRPRIVFEVQQKVKNVQNCIRFDSIALSALCPQAYLTSPPHLVTTLPGLYVDDFPHGVW